MKLLPLANARHELIKEASVSGANAQIAMDKMIKFIQRKLDEKLIRIPGVEHFHNSTDHGFGYRYVFSGTTRCLRFNWSSEPQAGKTSEITSIDIFSGKDSNPTFNVQCKGISFAQALPALVTILQSPSVGRIKVFPVSPVEALSESVIMEVARDAFTAEAALSDFLQKLTTGKTFTRSDFIGSYHIVHAGIFDTVYKQFADQFQIDAKRVSLKPGTKIDALKDSILSKAGVITVAAGGNDETFMKTAQEEKVEKENGDRVPFGDSLEHLEGLVTGTIKGAFNALFVAGKGGTGKTTVVERVLADHGLTDGNGYFKNTGSASAIGIYSLLYKHRSSILLFDDSDGALADVDSRNLIKAATDTKKHRKISWSKKSAGMYDPEHEDAEEYAEDADKLPKHFEFTGRIIFISNLPLSKLDPDGALRTRAFVINIDPTDEELFEHMKKILHEIHLEDGLDLTAEEREHVFEVVKKSKSKQDVSLRKLVRALNLAASGAHNWEKLVELYA
jgi:hypothetical protein